jgi:hypothetical protein
MSENFYETELRKSLRVEIESHSVYELGESSPFFEQLAKTYPVYGSKIDWGRVPSSVERIEEEVGVQIEQFIKFFDEMAEKFCLSGDVVYVGDSATDFALKGEVKFIRKALPEILTVPQHHYFIGPNSSWVICFTMEGDMGFGFRPKP